MEIYYSFIVVVRGVAVGLNFGLQKIGMYNNARDFSRCAASPHQDR